MKVINYHLKQGYLSEVYHEEIKDKINKYSSICIEGGTGIGKTEAIKLLALDLIQDYSRVIIACPYNKIVSNYQSKDIPKYEGSIMKLPKVCCMTYDRLAFLTDQDLKDSLVFIDESHTLSRERNFREALIILYKRINKIGKWVFVSATPEIETKDVEVKLQFSNNRPIINYYVKETNSIERYLQTLIKHQLLYRQFDRVVIFSDKHTSFLKDWYSDSTEVGVFHTKYIGTDEIASSQSYILDKLVYVATRVAFNGLNFNNQNENVLVVSVLEKETTAGTIIQQVGRFRKSNVTLQIVYKDKEVTESDIDDKQKLAEDCGVLGLSKNIVEYNQRFRDSDYVEIIKQLDDFYKEEADIEVIRMRLDDIGYFQFKKEDHAEMNFANLDDPVNKKLDNLIRNDWFNYMVDWDTNNIEHFGDIRDQKTAAIVQKLQEMYTEFMIDRTRIDRSMQQLNLMIDTIHAYYKRLYWIITHDPVSIQFDLDQLRDRSENYNGPLKKKVDASIKSINKDLEDYGFLPDMNTVVDKFCDKKVEQYEKAREKRANHMKEIGEKNGKKNGRKNAKRVCVHCSDGDKIFDSVQEATHFLRSEYGMSWSEIDLFKSMKNKWEFVK